MRWDRRAGTSLALTRFADDRALRRRHRVVDTIVAARPTFTRPACSARSASAFTPAGQRAWWSSVRCQAIANAKQAFAGLVGKDVNACAIVAKEGDAGDLDRIFASHPRIHTAEGCFYRDVLREACPVPASVIAPATLDPSRLGKLAPPPWGRDQKLATLAALKVMRR